MLFPYSCKRSTVHFARAPSSPPSTQGLRWLSPSIRSRGKNLGSFCIIHFPEQGKLQGISQNRANFQVQTGRFELIKQALTRRIPYGVETGKFFVVIREIIAEDQGILASFAQRDQNPRLRSLQSRQFAQGGYKSQPTESSTPENRSGGPHLACIGRPRSTSFRIRIGEYHSRIWINEST